MATADSFPIEIAYASSKSEACTFSMIVEPGTTVAEALATCGVLDSLGLGLDKVDVGVFGQVVRPSHVLRVGDRLEIYRALQVDPKEARRRRAEVGRSKPR